MRTTWEREQVGEDQARATERRLPVTRRFVMEGAMDRLPFPGGSTAGSGMGHFWVPVQIRRRDTRRFVSLRALVDTGSTYTWIPGDLLERVGVTPEEQRPFELADGRQVRYGMGWVQITLAGREQPTIVVFAPPGREPLLGVVTLEEFGLAADPVNERLISVPGLVKAALDNRAATRRCRAQPRMSPAWRVTPGRRSTSSASPRRAV